MRTFLAHAMAVFFFSLFLFRFGIHLQKEMCKTNVHAYETIVKWRSSPRLVSLSNQYSWHSVEFVTNHTGRDCVKMSCACK